MNDSNNNIFLSICIPTYNRPELLKRALLSIPEHPSVEVVVTDNSNNLKSKELTHSVFSASKLQWQYHKNDFPEMWPGSKLMVENFNMGIKLARGEYILFIHDDDFMELKDIKLLLSHLRNKPQSVYLFGVYLVDLLGKKHRKQVVRSEGFLSPKRALYKLLSDSSMVRFPTIVAHKTVYQKLGTFNPKCKGPTDLDMWSRMFAEYGVYCFPLVITAYTIHDTAQTMRTFNEQTLRILFDIFKNIQSWKILSDQQIFNAKSKFFHQFILAGAYRLLKKGKINEARKIMQLFKMREIKELNIPILWLPLRLLFSVLLFTPVLPLRLRISLN